jgi:hypothetical protein
LRGEIALNLYIAFNNVAIFTILILLIPEHESVESRL